MMLFIKHRYLKYFFLIILSIKSVSYVIENTALCLEKDGICQLDSDMYDNDDSDDERETEELQKIVEITSFTLFVKNSKTTNCHFLKHKNYLTQYLEFNTPPPELG